MPNRKTIKQKNIGGFTLIEMMVAVSIFAIVMTIAMGAIFTIVDANKKAQSLKSVMNNLNFALETMTRTIKTGQISSFNGKSSSIKVDVLDPSTNFSHNVIYSYETAVVAGKTIGYIGRSIGTNPISPITAPEVDITKLEFNIVNSGSGGKPMVVMIVKGETKLSERVKSPFNIQTTITQRLQSPE